MAGRTIACSGPKGPGIDFHPLSWQRSMDEGLHYLEFLLAGVLTLVALGPALSPASGVPLAAPPTQPVTFSKDVAPIIFKRCASCQRPGRVAPFSLLTHEDSRTRSALIANAVETRRMPPWKPEPGLGDFLGVRRLSDDEIETVRRSVAQGSPQGDPKDLAPAPEFNNSWFLGQPGSQNECETPPGNVHAPKKA